jgi:hypothetical protein
MRYANRKKTRSGEPALLLVLKTARCGLRVGGKNSLPSGENTDIVNKRILMLGAA